MIYSKFVGADLFSSADIHPAYLALHNAFQENGDYTNGFLYQPGGTVDEIYEPGDGLHLLVDEHTDPQHQRILAFPVAENGEFVGMHFLHPNY